MSMQTTPPTFADFAAVISYGGALSFSPDGSELAAICNADGQYNLWIFPVDGRAPRQITKLVDQAVRDVAWSPDGSRLLYTADTGGNEQHQLFTISPDGEGIAALTNRPDVQYFLAAQPWSPDGNYVAFAGNDREPTAQDLLIREFHTGEDERPIADGGIYNPVAWSPDNRWLTAVQHFSNTETEMILTDTQSGRQQRLLPGMTALYAPGPWASDGGGFWLLTDHEREFISLAFYDIGEAALDWVDTSDRTVEGVAASLDGHYLTWVVNDQGYSQFRLRDLQRGIEIPLPNLPHGTVKPYSNGVWFSPDNNTIATMLESPVRTSEIYLIDIAAQSVTQLTNSARVDLHRVRMIEPELIHVTAFDELHIPAWLFKPHGSGPFPLVMAIHGGPEAQERPTYAYRGLYQYLLHRGIGVLAPNIRGSTGYGKSYQQLIHRDLGGNDLKDFAVLVDYVRSLDWVDPERIGLFGGSYGGFAVLSCVSRLPEKEWAAAVDIVGPSNLVTMLRSFPPTWREIAKSIFGDVDTEEDDLLRRSPITYADQIRTPMLIIQGANDPRVVQAESDQIVAKLRENNIPVRYDVYEDEGHGFTRKENELKALGDSAAFLIDHLCVK